MEGDLAISEQARAVRARLGHVVEGLLLQSVLHVGAATAHYLAVEAGDGALADGALADGVGGGPYVVEILLGSLTRDASARDALLRAGRAGLRLRHPARVPLVGMGVTSFADEAGEVPYLVHAFAPGTPLDVLLDQDGPFDLDSALRIADAALSVVAHAHRRGFVHGRVELSKILFTDAPQTGLSDSAVTVLDCGATPCPPPGRALASSDLDPRLTAETRKDLVAVGLVLYATLAGERVALVTPRRDRIVQAVEQACDTHPFGARVERLLGRFLLRLLGVAGVPFQTAAEAWTELDHIRTLLAFADGLVESLAWELPEPVSGTDLRGGDLRGGGAALASLESGEHPVISVPPTSFVRPRPGALQLVLDDLDESVG